jgi:hypothetical protein
MFFADHYLYRRRTSFLCDSTSTEVFPRINIHFLGAKCAYLDVQLAFLDTRTSVRNNSLDYHAIGTRDGQDRGYASAFEHWGCTGDRSRWYLSAPFYGLQRVFDIGFCKNGRYFHGKVSLLCSTVTTTVLVWFSYFASFTRRALQSALSRLESQH